MSGRQHRALTFMETGLWLRAQYFARPGEDWQAATSREVNTVRNAVGILRRHHPGQNRHPGPGRGEIAGLRLHQWLEQPGRSAKRATG